MEISLREKIISLDDFVKTYHKPDFIKYCQACENYQANWACPPLAFSPEDYLEDFKSLVVILVKIDLDEEEKEASRGQDLLKESIRILRPVKEKYCQELLKREEAQAGSRALFPGSCTYCETCQRKKGLPCLRPEVMRYSMDSFGFDVSKITTDLFGVPLLWGRETFPDYYSLVYGLLLP